MKNVIFKVRFNHPNKSKTPSLNARHFDYICKRPRAMHNDGQNFCCFGKVSEIGYSNFGNINEFDLIKKHILKKSKDKTTFYKCIISLKEEDAVEKGFENRNNWEELIKNNAKKLAKEMSIKIEDFEYVCSVHMEKGHPHMHLMAWDKNQEILRESIPKHNIYKIRRFLTNDVFKDDLQNLYDNKNKSKDNYKNFLKDMIKELDPTFTMTDEEYKKYDKELKTLDLDLNNSKIFNINLDDNYVSKIMKDIYLLRKDLPKTGRLNYAFMPENVKKEIDVISKKILASNIDVRKNFENYIKSMEDITKFSTKNEKYIDKSIKSAEDELLNFTGNQILNICKNINKKEFKIRKEEFEEYKKEKDEEQTNFEKQEMLSLLSNLISFMNKNESKNNNKFLKQNNENSLVAKKELAKKMENKSNIEWER
ncbi:MobP3 family relaxase [uncultured Tyzzerella sp.]|uniref:MobP3 family relaxase n=1 Tax=uncultured Tyzzerella sp. TaxID=2321398 RepID=UPI0029438961|nr:MobP3 family relaxase [uncultured Tyzzerella sp.]